MYEWILPSLSEVLAWSQAPAVDTAAKAEWTPITNQDNAVRAQRQWRSAIAALEKLLLQTLDPQESDTKQGLVLAGPVPVFCHSALMHSLQTVTFTAKPFNALALMPFPLPAAIPVATAIHEREIVLPLLAEDPVANEQFCLVLTAKFAFVVVLGQDSNGIPVCLFSFAPEAVEQVWRLLGARIVLNQPHAITELDAEVKQYPLIAPDYRLVMQFSQLLLNQVPGEEQTGKLGSGELEADGEKPSPIPNHQSPIPDVELLQAFAHEVRTPLTTIRTMTRLLLKRRDLPPDVLKRLQVIDRECTEQIDRMELMFRAAELETSNSTKNTCGHLTPMPLEQVLQQSIPRWQSSAMRRNLTIDVVLPQQIPNVVSNPAMLDQVLTGLMENFTRSLPAGSHITVQIIPAGDQLKLQLLAQPTADNAAIKSASHQPIRKSLGQLLTFQPETGTISLNLAATKHLFQAIGGKLIVRQRPDNSEVLTVYLPLDGKKNK